MIVLIIATLVILLNSWHVIAAWFQKPTGTYFTGIAHYYTDYFLYTSLMVQKGWVYTAHLFTNEPLKPTWIYWLYTLLGKLGNPFVVYNASIAVFSAIALCLWWHIFKKTSQHPILAFLFLATASGFTDFWFSPLPALNRLGGVPHQIFQTILLLGVILSLEKPALLSVLSFLAAITNPVTMLLLAIAIVASKPRMMFFLLPAAAGALLTNAEFSRDPILAAAKIWENSQNISVNPLQFVLAIGPIAFLIPFGLKNISPLSRVFLSYGLLSFIIFFSPIPHVLGTSPVRWLSPAAYTILPVLAAEGLKKYRIPIIALYLLLTIPSLGSQIKARQNVPQNLQYIPLRVIQELKQIKGAGVILTNTPYDVVIPVFTGRKTFTGHPIHTLYPDVKEALRNKYFSGAMTEEEKQQFLSDHNITTIFP